MPPFATIDMMASYAYRHYAMPLADDAAVITLRCCWYWYRLPLPLPPLIHYFRRAIFDYLRQPRQISAFVAAAAACWLFSLRYFAMPYHAALRRLLLLMLLLPRYYAFRHDIIYFIVTITSFRHYFRWFSDNVAHTLSSLIDYFHYVILPLFRRCLFSYAFDIFRVTFRCDATPRFIIDWLFRCLAARLLDTD